MKALTLAFFVSSLFTVFAGTPIPQIVPIDGVFSPFGFDSNDNTEVVVSGYLPNLCHRSPMTKVYQEGNKVNIKVEALHYAADNPFCVQMIVPFVESVSLGVLDKGTYNIVVNGRSMFEKKSKIKISESTSDAVDEYVYANVDYIEKEEGSRIVKLKGYNPSECFVLDEVSFIGNGLDTFSVLPKMKQVSEFCPMKMVPFEYNVKVPKTLSPDRILLHVRSMDGKSINTVFNNTIQ